LKIFDRRKFENYVQKFINAKIDVKTPKSFLKSSKSSFKSPKIVILIKFLPFFKN